MSGLDKFMKSSPKSQKGSDSKNIDTPPNQEGKQSRDSKRKQPTPNKPKILEEDVTEEYSTTDPLEEEDADAEEITPSNVNTKFLKHQLKCPNKKCNYQRILMKSTLIPSDFTCPKCGTEMHQKSK